LRAVHRGGQSRPVSPVDRLGRVAGGPRRQDAHLHDRRNGVGGRRRRNWRARQQGQQWRQEPCCKKGSQTWSYSNGRLDPPFFGRGPTDEASSLVSAARRDRSKRCRCARDITEGSRGGTPGRPCGTRQRCHHHHSWRRRARDSAICLKDKFRVSALKNRAPRVLPCGNPRANNYPTYANSCWDLSGRESYGGAKLRQ
jgi:hypothetical protein